jgi:NAD(P)-dependent dehydrogenase (short-subunit alcohol dehydrogenase family)
MTRLAVVTGGARRLGRAFAEALAADGWPLLIHANQAIDEARAFAASLAVPAKAIAADLADPAAVAHLADAILAEPFDELLLVNNASMFSYDAPDSWSTAAWDAHMAVNARAPAQLFQALDAALKPGQRGLVINLLDAKLRHLNPDYYSYTISKMAFWGVHELMCLHAPPRWRVVGIAPGITLVSGEQTRDNFDTAHQFNLLERGVTAADLVNALRYAITTPSVHGDILTVDSGLSMMGLRRDVAFEIAKRQGRDGL